MNIFPPTAPTFGIQLVDGDQLVGVLDQEHDAVEAVRLLRRIRGTFPNSTLATRDFDGWAPVSDEELKRAIYLHSIRVMDALTREDLPLAFWQLSPYQPDKLEGKLHIDDLGDARKAIEAYADALGVKEISERPTEHATYLELGVVVWGGVRIEVSTYTSKRKPAGA